MALNREKIVAGAQKFIQRGQLDKAIKEFQRIIEEDPKDVRTLLKIGDLFSKKGERDNATQTYLKVAEFYSDQGFFLKAVAVYKQILKVDPGLIDVNIKLADLYSQLGLGSDAISQYQGIAQYFESAGQTQKTLQVLRKMADLDPQNVGTRIKLAELMVKESMLSDALQEFQHAAAFLKQSNRLDDFAKVAERILHLDGNNLRLAKELAAFYLQKQDPKRALAKLQACFKADPKDTATLELLAQAFNALGQTPKTVSVYRELAKLHADRGEQDRRRQYLKKILEIAPDDEEARADVEMRAAPAVVPPKATAPVAAPSAPPLRTTAPPPQAIANTVTNAPAAAPSAPTRPQDVLQKLLTETDVYIKYGLKDKALDHLKKIFALGADNLEAHAKVRDIYLHSGDVDGAVATLITMVGIAEKRQDLDQATRWLQDILKLAPNNQSAMRRLHALAPETEPELIDDDGSVDLLVDDHSGNDEPLDEVVPASTTPDAPEIDVVIGAEDDGAQVDVAFEEDLFESPIPADEPEAAAVEPSNHDTPQDDAEQRQPHVVPVAFEDELAGNAGLDDADQPEEELWVDSTEDPAAPETSVEEPPRQPEPQAVAGASVPDVSDELEEAGFFEQQGLNDESIEIYKNILRKIPGHPEARERLIALTGSAPGEPAAPAPAKPAAAAKPTEPAPAPKPLPSKAVSDKLAPATSSAVRAGGATKQMLSDEALQDDGAFDLASELAADLGGDEPEGIGEAAAEELQFSVEDVFAEFKKGVAQTVSDQDYATHYDLGIAYKEMGLTDDAAREFQVAARAPEKEVDSLTMIGICRLDAGDKQAALDAFKKAGGSDRATAKQAMAIQYEIANVQDLLGQKDLARTLFAKVAKLDPAFRDAGKRAAGAVAIAVEEDLSLDDEPTASPPVPGRTTNPESTGKKGKISYL